MSNLANTHSRATPNCTFALLLVVSASLLAAIAWSTHHLLVIGAPITMLGTWPGMSCLLVPDSRDLGTHITSYAFLLAIIAGLGRGAWAVCRQQRQTTALLRACRARPAEIQAATARTFEQLGLHGRVDVVDVSTAVAFCYGYTRPRIIVSRGLLQSLSLDEVTALLLHEREHLRQHDPLKVAVGRLLASGVFFVPVLGGLYRRYLTEKEIAADRAAIAAQGSAAALSSALVRLVDLQAMPRPQALVGADEVLEARIDVLLGEPGRAAGWFSHQSVLRSALVAVMVVLPLAFAAPPAAASHQGHALIAGCHVVTATETPGSRTSD